MRQFTINTPLGTDAETDMANRVLRMLMEQLQVYNGNGVRWQQTPRGLRLRVTIPPAGSRGGINWQTPNKELDPTVDVSINTLVYISPENPLVTVGLTDLTTGTIIQAMAGIWLSLQQVPAQITVGMVTKYNVPQVLPTGATSGVPLEGDADNADVFWIPISGVMNCG